MVGRNWATTAVCEFGPITRNVLDDKYSPILAADIESKADRDDPSIIGSQRFPPRLVDHDWADYIARERFLTHAIF